MVYNIYMDEKEKYIMLAKYRRDLHRIPELGRDLPKTTAYIREHLSQLPCEIKDAGDAGFCAIFRANVEPGDTEQGNTKPSALAFRTDMDALPIIETTGFTFASEHEGKMHACGHDGHMAIMLGFADELTERINAGALARDAVLIFQAAEETVGGAKDICESNILQEEGVSAVYGLHIWPGQTKNEIISRKGEFMASTREFYINIEGKSSHVGTYKKGIDALEIACNYVRRVYEAEQREISPDIHRLLRFGILKSGTASNIVSNHAYLEGTLRTYSKSVSDLLRSHMVEIAENIEAKTGCKFAFEYSEPYPAVINPPKLFDEARRILQSAGLEFTEPDLPLMIAEDFSFYQQYFPALFLHLATGVDKMLHRGDYTIDEDVLFTGVKVYTILLDSEAVTTQQSRYFCAFRDPSPISTSSRTSEYAPGAEIDLEPKLHQNYRNC
jgi:hippurate hydrolase